MLYKVMLHKGYVASTGQVAQQEVGHDTWASQLLIRHRDEEEAMKLSGVQLAAVSGPAVPMFALMMPLVIFVPPYFADQAGLGMAVVGTIFMMGRLFDVVSDPIAGIIMDKTHKTIRKLTWVLIGAVPLALATWQIFFPEGLNSPFSLMFWLLVLYLGWTAMNVGLFSWASELASDYHERSRVMGAIQMANVIGTLLVLSIPAGIELMGLDENVSQRRIEAMGTVILVLLPIMLLFAWKLAPKPEKATSPSQETMMVVVKEAFHHRSLRRLILADLALGLSVALLSSLSVFYVEIVLGLEGRAGVLQLVMLASSFVGLPLFIRLSRGLEKHITLMVAVSCTATGAVIASFAPVGNFAYILVGYVLLGFAFGGQQMLPRSIMSDILEERQIETGSANTSLYFAILSTTFKLGLGLGVGLTYFLAGLGGFDPETARQSSESHWVIRVMIGLMPLLLASIVFAAMRGFPLNRERYEEIRKQVA